jgi:hypothetical protein
MKHYAVNELQIHYSPELKKIGTVKELTQGTVAQREDPTSVPMDNGAD